MCMEKKWEDNFESAFLQYGCTNDIVTHKNIASLGRIIGFSNFFFICGICDIMALNVYKITTEKK